MHHHPIAVAAALLALTCPAQAQDAYDGWYWNRATGYWQGRDIWGNGPYGFGLSGVRGDNGLVEWQGPGTHSGPANLGHWVDTPTTVTFESAPPDDQWGNTYSGGRFTLPAASPFPAVIKASFHLYSVLGDNPGGEQTFTVSEVTGSFYTNNSQWPRVPLHWRIDYRMDVEGSEYLIGNGSATILGGGGSFGEGVGSFTGILDSAPQGFNTNLIVPFGVSVSAADRGGLPAIGRADVWVDVYLSRSAIAAVPEPGTWALMLAGIATVGGLARRRTRVDPPA
jgi:PEP-CTERM motif